MVIRVSFPLFCLVVINGRFLLSQRRTPYQDHMIMSHSWNPIHVTPSHCHLIIIGYPGQCLALSAQFKVVQSSLDSRFVSLTIVSRF
jgi:hypothetical protein